MRACIIALLAVALTVPTASAQSDQPADDGPPPVVPFVQPLPGVIASAPSPEDWAKAYVISPDTAALIAARRGLTVPAVYLELALRHRRRRVGDPSARAILPRSLPTGDPSPEDWYHASRVPPDVASAIAARRGLTVDELMVEMANLNRRARLATAARAAADPRR